MIEIKVLIAENLSEFFVDTKSDSEIAEKICLAIRDSLVELMDKE